MINTGYRPSEPTGLLSTQICLDAAVALISLLPEGSTLNSQYATWVIPPVSVTLQGMPHDQRPLRDLRQIGRACTGFPAAVWPSGKPPATRQWPVVPWFSGTMADGSSTNLGCKQRLPPLHASRSAIQA
jgi:hypothetical protein